MAGKEPLRSALCAVTTERHPNVDVDMTAEIANMSLYHQDDVSGFDAQDSTPLIFRNIYR